jgi:PIN domain nuclease of toxin-antitoxin system
MRLLLDTHAFLWWDSSNAQLPEKLRSAVADPGNAIFVSAVTVWEIGIKRASGKLIFTASVARGIEVHGFIPLAITVAHAEWAGSLPQLHRDPFDRLLIAEAHLEGLTLVTLDEQILRYQVPHL